MAFLKHIYNGSTISIYELRGSVVIGRQAECNIHVEDATVSGRHARIELDAGTWLLVDLGSTNGVFANGKNIDTLELKAGAVFAIGTHTFEFHLELPSQLDQTLKIKKSWIPGIYYTE